MSTGKFQIMTPCILHLVLEYILLGQSSRRYLPFWPADVHDIMLQESFTEFVSRSVEHLDTRCWELGTVSNEGWEYEMDVWRSADLYINDDVAYEWI